MRLTGSLLKTWFQVRKKVVRKDAGTAILTSRPTPATSLAIVGPEAAVAGAVEAVEATRGGQEVIQTTQIVDAAAVPSISSEDTSTAATLTSMRSATLSAVLSCTAAAMPSAVTAASTSSTEEPTTQATGKATEVVSSATVFYGNFCGSTFQRLQISKFLIVFTNK